MEILFILLILLVTARAFGEFAARLGQPALVGELLAGISLGIVIQFSPDLFPIMNNINDNEVFTSLNDLGIFFLMVLAGLPAFWMTRSWKEALIVGTGMNARGAVGLIIADIALRQGLFLHPEPAPAVLTSLFSAIVFMAVVTTLLTPIGLRWVVSNLPVNK
jgi:Kef-type K+ transport system membrane component KefB